MKSGCAAAALASALVLGGCSGLTAFDPEPVAPKAPLYLPSPHPVAGLVGSWGVATYQADKDKARARLKAKAQCKQPYVIAKGPTDGVMMHVADDPTLYELTLKGAPDGKTYLGFNAAPGDASDREVLAFSQKEVILRFVDADANARLGTAIFVRC